jgi:hypothetical protein
MTHVQMNLLLRATDARRSVERTLQGALPRSLTKRFRQLMRLSRQPVMIKEVVHVHATEDSPARETVRLVPNRLSRLAAAGHLIQELRQVSGES